jgi:glycosyltransferase involved in cell wall biosynthesis
LKEGFSIIICCFNSQNKIIETLEYISKLKNDSILFEVLLVNNGSTDLTKHIAKEILSKTSIDYQLIDEPISGKPNALLKGFEFSQYDKMIVCDDDVLLTENYLEIANNYFNQHPGIGILGGRGIVKNELQLPFWFSAHQNAFAIGSQANETSDITEEKGYIWGAGSIINKNAWVNVKNNGFDYFYTGLIGNNRLMAGEDSEISIWIKHVGYKLFYHHDLIYIHNLAQDRITWSNLVKLHIGFSRSQVYLYLLKEILAAKSNNTNIDIHQYIRSQIKVNATYLFNGFFSIKYFKILWIAFLQKREGYVPALLINDKYLKIKEHIINKKNIVKMFRNTVKNK